METDNSEDQKRLSSENGILWEDKTVEGILAKSHYFNCFSLYLMGKQADSNSNTKYMKLKSCFKLENGQDLNFMKKLAFFSLFKANSLKCINMGKRNKHLKNFILTSFPAKVNILIERGGRKTISRASLCFSGIIRDSSKVVDTVIIQRFRLNRRQLKRLIASFSHVNVIRLNTCILSVPTPFTFPESLPSSKIKKLDLEGSCSIKYLDCNRNSEQFRNFIQGLATYPGFKMSLDTLRFSAYKKECEEANNILSENGFENIKVTFWK
ncbi:unnamed protein product [Moneuplotes crassus]|uniref:Uncharacterized protein n=1 Tax=Euplotes crassus TaxID=5936 RepID=A0AAD1X916_EUPCR|nr:unnamed protein product [Moneuplotes crassus]